MNEFEYVFFFFPFLFLLFNLFNLVLCDASRLPMHNMIQILTIYMRIYVCRVKQWSNIWLLLHLQPLAIKWERIHGKCLKRFLSHWQAVDQIWIIQSTKIHICSTACGCTSGFRRLYHKRVLIKGLNFDQIIIFLIDEQQMFSLEKSTSKKCYMLSARDVSITWACNPLYWTWRPLVESRFAFSN